ncbi:hypothetical protein FFLO_02655 [Filobasidium floriforme]|uniref:Uncharacterized protein n=1 Tax=Filobasidium floriforme TaxID=5210 RepID=A0A8K0JSI0_9TREE|nr:uncharacterized protein HD553DRAFT_303918 [Filobasidium floriforme]KAG7561926.1 hypothetical protein FFLO_02655 [Filobasidium floriforme]KAH8089407.1 hypothetical protein HD553DRAFT_303918 [Filobasidium floriforme]
MATPASQTTPVNALQAALGPEAFKAFEDYIMTKIKTGMEKVRKTATTSSESDYLKLIERCVEHISDTVEPVLLPMLGKYRVLIVRCELYLNRVGKDLGVKWKETEMFKRYIGPSDHWQEHADAKRMKSIPEHIDLEPATSVITSTSEPASPSRSLPMDDAQVDPLSDETTDPDSESSNNTPTYSFSGQERSGRLKLDIHMSSVVTTEATKSDFGCTGYTPKQIIALLVQVEYIPEKELRGTGLEALNSDHGREEVGSVQPISSAIIKILQAGIINAVWKSVAVYTMSQDRDPKRGTAAQTIGSRSRPIYSMFFLNGRFMRLAIRDRVVRIEFSSDKCGNRGTDRNEVQEAETTLTSTSNKRGTMSGLLARMNMKDGCRSLLRHHITTEDGMKRFWKWCGAAVWSFVPTESEPDSDSDRVRSTSSSTPASTAVRSPMRTGRKTVREEVIGSDLVGTSTPTLASNGVRKRGRTKSVAGMDKGDNGNEERDEDGDDDGRRGNRGKRTKVLVAREQDELEEDDDDDYHEDDDGDEEQGGAENPTSRTRAGGQKQDEETSSRDVEMKSKAGIGIKVDKWRSAIETKTTAEASEIETRDTKENPRPQLLTPSDDLEVGAGDHAMDSEEYMEYVELREKMRILDGLGWRVEYCSPSEIELFADMVRK